MSCYITEIPYPASMTQSRFNMLTENIKYRTDDILLITYPKCGTTWIEQVILLLLLKGDYSALNPASKNVYIPGAEPAIGKIWPEACIEQDPQLQLKMSLESKPITWKEFDDAPSRRVLKSHAPISLVLGNPFDVKKIIVTRNPLDACVSSYYHAFNPFKSGWPFSAWASLWLKGFVPHGSWFSWVKDWYIESQKNTETILFIRYEDVKVNAKGEIIKIAKFLNIDVTEDELEKVLKYSSFSSMKEQSLSKGGDFGNHLRKGETGDWESHFSDELFLEFVESYKEKMSGCDLKYSIGINGSELTS